MSKVTATLGRNFIRSKEFKEAQTIGLEMVKLFDEKWEIIFEYLYFRNQKNHKNAVLETNLFR